jgi:transposase-like protein
MTNLMIPFECPICGSDGFRQVEVKDRDGRTRLTQAYECRGCSTMFRERERFAAKGPLFIRPRRPRKGPCDAL